MGPTALLLLTFFALKIWRLRPGVNQRTWIPKASVLPLERRNRYKNKLLHFPCVSSRSAQWHLSLTVRAEITDVKYGFQLKTLRSHSDKREVQLRFINLRATHCWFLWSHRYCHQTERNCFSCEYRLGGSSFQLHRNVATSVYSQCCSPKIPRILYKEYMCVLLWSSQ
jgi:hypothetical protein